MSEKVSIIIPTYNRSDIIGETLNSVMAQTYTNWECIVVDDGSNDNTEQVLEAFIQKDTKFQYHKRPDNKPKGANACRNYGLELSKGAYVNWFDSDDLMMPNFLQAKVNYCIENNCDFVFSNTNNFNQNGIEKPMFHVNFDKYEISADNFIQQKIVWSTLDFLCKKESIKDLKFNEELKSGQEYNFFSRYLIKTINGKHLDKVLAKRRVHESSIQEHQKNNKTQ